VIYPKVGDEVDYPWFLESIEEGKDGGNRKYTFVNKANGMTNFLWEPTFKKVLEGKEHLTKAFSNKYGNPFIHPLGIVAPRYVRMTRKMACAKAREIQKERKKKL
jgi:hypothetical protein